MIAVVVRADQPELFNIVRTLFHACTRGDSEIDLDKPPAVWEQIEKFDLDEPFWQMVKATFGYEEESPSLRNFLLRLLVTDFAHHSRATCRRPWSTWFCRSGLRRTPWSAWPNGGTAAAGEQLRPAVPAAAAILQMEDHLAESRDRRPPRRDDVPGRREAIAGSCETGSGTADTINADEVRADRHPAAGRPLGLA